MRHEETDAPTGTRPSATTTSDAPGPLRLTQVTVSNFRNIIQPQTAKLIDNLTVLVGANGSGKTTVLDAIRCLIEPTTADGGDDTSVIEGCFFTTNQQQERVRARFDGAKWQREVLTLVHPMLEKTPEKATAVDLRKFLGSSENKDALVAMADEHIATLPSSELVEMWAPLTQSVADRLPRLIRFNAESALDPHAEIEKLTQREFQRFVQQEDYADLTQQLGNRFQRDIAATMNAVNNTVQRRCGEIVSGISASASIEFTKIKPTVDVRATTNDTDLSVAQLSLGQRRRMGLAVHEALTQVLQAGAVPGWDLIVYDEPDTHLDFFAQRRLADVLREQAGVPTAQVVVATHAPRLIDQVRPQALVHLRAEQDNAVIENLVDLMGADESGESDLLAQLDRSLGNSALLAERCIVIVEGSSDAAALDELYRRQYGVSLRNDGVVVIDRDGGTDAVKLARLIIQRWRRKVLLVLDRDQDTERESTALHRDHPEECELHFVGERELEDCFSDECWAATITAWFDLDVPWTSDDIATLREEARNSWKGFSKVVENACDARGLRASKVDLARQVAHRTSLDEQGPDLIDLLKTISRDGRE